MIMKLRIGTTKFLLKAIGKNTISPNDSLKGTERFLLVNSHLRTYTKVGEKIETNFLYLKRK